jgi:cytoskeletal protein RodZ
VIDIGHTLRDARRRRDLDLAACEQATRIRGRYLAALEDERFELLPEPAYARSFLRTYAAHLGLDPEPLVAELDERIGHGEPRDGPVVRQTLPRAMPQGPPSRGGRARRARLAWLGAGAAAGIGVVIWIGAGTGSGPERLDVPAVTVTTAPVVTATVPRAAAPATTPRRTAPPAATAGAGRLVLTGLPPGGSWLQVRRGGPRGAVLYEGTVRAGTARRFAVGRSLWLRVGWGGGLRARVGGRTLDLPDATADVLVRPDGTLGVSPG